MFDLVCCLNLEHSGMNVKCNEWYGFMIDNDLESLRYITAIYYHHQTRFLVMVDMEE